MANSLIIKVDIDSTGAVKGAHAVGRAADDAGSEISTSFGKARQGVESISETLKQTRQQLIAFFSVRAIADGVRALVKAQVAMQQIHYTLLGATGSAQQANAAFGFVERTAEKLGIKLQETSLGFAQLSAAANANGVSMAKQEELFKAFAKAATVFHLGTEQSRSAIMALQQMFAKGTVQAQELRLQLGQAIPTAVPYFMKAVEKARGGAAGMNGSFRKLLQSGTLVTKDVLPQLIEALQKSGRGWQAASEGLNANLNRVSNAWFKLKVAFSQGLNTTTVTGGLHHLARAMDSVADHAAAIVDAASAIGAALALNFGSRGLRAVGNLAKAQLTLARSRVAETTAVRAQTAASVAETQARSTELTRTLQAIDATRAEATATLAAANAAIVYERRHLVAAKAAGTLSFAVREQTLAMNGLTAAKGRQMQATTALATLGRQEAAVRTDLAASATAQVAAQTRLASSVTGVGLAMRGLRKVGRSLFSLIGGWPTLLFAAGAAVVYLATRQTAAEKVASTLADTTERLAKARDHATQSAVEQARRQVISARAVLEADKRKLAKLQAQKNLPYLTGSSLLIADRAAANAQDDIDKLKASIKSLQDQIKFSISWGAFAASTAALGQSAKRGAQNFDALRKSLAKQNAALKQQIATYGKSKAAQLAYAESTLIAGERAKNAGNIATARVATIRKLFAPLIKNAKLLDAKKAADQAATKASQAAKEVSAKRKAALDDLNKSLAAYASATAQLAQSNADARDKLQGMTQAQIDYRSAIRDAVTGYDQLIAKGATAAAASELLHARVLAAQGAFHTATDAANKLSGATDDLGQTQAGNIGRANAYFRAIDEGAQSMADSFAQFLTGTLSKGESFASQMVDLFKRMIAQIIAQYAKLKVFGPIMHGLFGQAVSGSQSALSGLYGGGSGSSPFMSWMSKVGSGIADAFSGSGSGSLLTTMKTGFSDLLAGIGGVFGIGGSTATAGSFSGMGALMGGTYTGGTGLMAAGGTGSAAAGSSGLLSGLSSIPIAGWIAAAVLGNFAMYKQGWNPSSDINKDMWKNSAWDQGQFSILTANKMLSDIGLSDKWASLLSGASLVTRIWGHQDPHAIGGGINAAFGPGGVNANQYVNWKASGGWFSNADYGTDTQALTGKVLDSLTKMWDGITRTMTRAARALGTNVDAALDNFSAGLKTVAGKDGKVTDYIVTYLGKTWHEATSDAAQLRIGAEGLLHVLQATVGNVATQFASQWQDDAKALADGVSTMMSVQDDLTHGYHLLATGASGTFTQVMRLVEAMQTGSETLAQSYAKLKQANAAYLQFVGQFEPKANTFGAALQSVAQQMQANIKQANALARAAGLDGARTQDLTHIHEYAAKQAAAAIATLTTAAQTLATKLYGVTTNSLQAVTAQLDKLQSKTQSALQLAIGDKSPLSGQEKLALALKGLRSGLTNADDVLSLGRKLYANTADYAGLFAKVQSILGQPGASGVGSLNAAIDDYAHLYGKQQALQGQADATARFGDAKTLAQYLADISTTHGVSYGDAAQNLGFSLKDLSKDLGVTNLTGYLDKLKLQDIGGGTEASTIVQSISQLGHDLVQSITGAPLAADTTVLAKISTGTDEQTTLLKSIDQRLADIEGHSADTAGTNKSMADDSKRAKLDDLAHSRRGARV